MQIWKGYTQLAEDSSSGRDPDPVLRDVCRWIDTNLRGAQLMRFDRGTTQVLMDLAESMDRAGQLPSQERLAFNHVFLEVELTEGKMFGALIHRVGNEVIISSIKNFSAQPLYPLGCITVIGDDETTRTDPMTSALESRWNAMGPDISKSYMDMSHEFAHFAIIALSVFSTLRCEEDVFLEDTERVYSRSERRRADRGKDNTTSIETDRTFTHIRLGEMGRRHAEAMVGDGSSSRRSHWVRGHMFLARNGRMTWRRPHIRGTGEVHDTVRSVTAGGAVAAK